MYVGAIATGRWLILLFAAMLLGAACSPDLPDAVLWKKAHSVYPNVTNIDAAAACRNQSNNALGQLHGSQSEELYAACMEAFGFVQLTPEEATATSAAQ